MHACLLDVAEIVIKNNTAASGVVPLKRDDVFVHQAIVSELLFRTCVYLMYVYGSDVFNDAGCYLYRHYHGT